MSDTHETPAILALERPIAFLVRRLEANQRRRNYPLERAHYLLLLMLEEQEPQSSGTLAEQLGLDSSTVTRQINVMLRHELITRTPDPHDRRGGLLYLTDHGRQQLDQMRKLRRESARELFADWDEPSRAELARLLERLNNTIEQRVAEHFSRSRS